MLVGAGHCEDPCSGASSVAGVVQGVNELVWWPGGAPDIGGLMGVVGSALLAKGLL